MTTKRLHFVGSSSSLYGKIQSISKGREAVQTSMLGEATEFLDGYVSSNEASKSLLIISPNGLNGTNQLLEALPENFYGSTLVIDFMRGEQQLPPDQAKLIGTKAQEKVYRELFCQDKGIGYLKINERASYQERERLAADALSQTEQFRTFMQPTNIEYLVGTIASIMRMRSVKPRAAYQTK